MVRYIMSFKVPDNQLQLAEKVIKLYFDALDKQGPGGMRSQCYADDSAHGSYVHIKSFKKESVANQHFRSTIFREYVQKLGNICGLTPSFSRLQQQETFESIY
jgi:quinol monooxygenase YgiN